MLQNSLRRGDFLMYAGIRLDVGAPDVQKQGIISVGEWLHETASTISTVVEAFTKKTKNNEVRCFRVSVSLGPGLKKNVSSMRFGDASEIKQL